MHQYFPQLAKASGNLYMKFKNDLFDFSKAIASCIACMNCLQL